MLEVIWGEGYMAPGGAGNVAKMLDGLNPSGKRILDIGSGLGGPAIEMVKTHDAKVLGIDLEEPLVAHAYKAAMRHGVSSGCGFQKVNKGPLPFAENSFDIVTSSGAFTQTKDKLSLFKEVNRVLKPGGWLSAYDWMKSAGEYSSDMLYWFEMEGLTYEMVTPHQQEAILADAGFTSISSLDASDWYKQRAKEEYHLLKDKFYEELVTDLGQEDTDDFVENWRAMSKVIDQDEMLQVYSRAQKPIHPQ